MAKNFGKFLLLTGVVAAAGAGVYYYLKKKDDLAFDYEDEDFDNDVLDDDASNRSYVSLEQDEKAEKAENVEAADEVPFQKLSSLVSDTAKKAEEKTEEFFDEDEAPEEE